MSSRGKVIIKRGILGPGKGKLFDSVTYTKGGSVRSPLSRKKGGKKNKQ